MSNVERLPLPKKPQKRIEKTDKPGIYKVIYPSGLISWKAIAFNKGKQLTETFSKKGLAENWKKKNEVHAEEKRAFITSRIFERTKVRELAELYLNGGEINGKEVDGGIGIRGKPLGPTAKVYVNKFIKWLKLNGDPTIGEFDEDKANDYLKMRLREMYQHKGWRYERKVKPPSVKREKISIQVIWKVARKEWGFKGLANPWDGLDIAGSDRVKERRLRDGELHAMLDASSNSYGRHKFYVPYVLTLAIQTGMRPVELFDLAWKDVDLKKRRILVRKSEKNNIHRMIVMTNGAFIPLLAMRIRLFQAKGVKLSDEEFNRIILNTKDDRDYVLYPDVKGFTENGERVAQNRFDVWFHEARDKAGLYDPDPATMADRLTLYTFRHEANSRFLEAGLDHYQVKRMMGHKIKGDMTVRYDTWTQDDEQLKRIQKILDEYQSEKIKTMSEEVQDYLKTVSEEEMKDAYEAAFKQMGLARQSPFSDLTPQEEKDLEEWKAL